jgi:serine/threonine-protein kinase PpkA
MSIFRKITLISSLFFIFFLCFSFQKISAQTKTPLLMEGKTTLYQKVVTLPGALFRDSPTSDPKDSITTFTVMYVYDRQDYNGFMWLQCGTGTTADNLTWIRQDRLMEWKQSLVLIFSEKTGRSPLLFFKRKADIVNIATNPGITNVLNQLTVAFKKYKDEGAIPPTDYPVVGMEPENDEGAIPSDKFYLMPIFNYDEQFSDFKVLEVASINPGNPDLVVSSLPTGSNPEVNPNDQKPPKLGFAFVIDTTVSMGPYIEMCRSISRDIYQKIIDSGNAEDMSLAFVAFRSSVKAAPGIEYTSKVISPFKNALDKDSFESSLSQVKEATISTHSFNEDSIAGLYTAVNDLDWSSFDGGVILLLTDAGPLDRSDQYRSVEDNPATIKEKAASKNIRIVTIHLKTPQGNNNHTYAQEAYQTMSFEAAGLKGYVDIPIKDVNVGTETYKNATRDLVNNLDTALRSFNLTVPTSVADDSDTTNDPVKKAADIGSLLGYSIRLDYLGSQKDTSPPTVVRSWITDMDLSSLDSKNKRNVRTIQVAVLLSRNQLSALIESLQSIVKGAENSRLQNEPFSFFDYVISAAAELTRDPGKYALNPGANKLVETGVINEFLDGLPYKSEVMNITEDDWDKMGDILQVEFIEDLKSKISVYQSYYIDVNNWTKFDKENEGDSLYRVPLTMLP